MYWGCSRFEDGNGGYQTGYANDWNGFAAQSTEATVVTEDASQTSTQEAPTVGAIYGGKGKGKNNSNNCGQAGHWASDCPNRFNGKGKA